MVQKDEKNSYLLMSGQRRLAALKRLGAKKIPVLLLTNATRYELEDAKAASVVENLHRNKMNTKDTTAACVFLTESIGKSKAASSLGISSQTLRKYLGFAAVPEKLREFVPQELSRDDCTKLYGIIPNVTWNNSKCDKGYTHCRENHSTGPKIQKRIPKIIISFPKIITSQITKKSKE